MITKQKLIYNNIIPFKGFIAINLFGLLFIRREYKDSVTEYILNHEYIHTKQMKELWYIPFYIMYLFWWIKMSIRYKSTRKGYYNIPFEKEAFENQHDLEYVKNRKKYAWKDYK